MTDVPKIDEFKELLMKKLLSYQIDPKTAEAISTKIRPVSRENFLIVAQCEDDFYSKNIVSSMLPQIKSAAQECWGENTQLVINEAPKVDLQPQKPPRRRKRRASSVSEPEESLFAWENGSPTNQAESPSPKSHVQTEENRVDGPGSSTSDTTGEGQSQRHFNLQRDLSFQTFVRGQSNMVAYSACEAVARNPGQLSNPVFIYGATGLGKTHLLNSVGNEIFASHPNWKVVYISSQEFMNELITSIRFNKTGNFRKKYHAADVLLVDDIQFLENKDSTQMEFFHIFNVLCEKKKQIVITSDKYPKDIPNIEERLKSRFLQGLIADIEPPSYEDRLAIIESKALMMKLKLSQEIIVHIASHMKSNVREIQGLLTNLLMNQSMTGRAPTIESINEVLRRIINVQAPTTDIQTIQKVVAQHFSLKVSDLTSPKREKRLVLPRHVAMFLAKDILGLALKEIAESFHRGDHTTVKHAIQKVEKLMGTDESTRASVKELRRKLEQCR